MNPHYAKALGHFLMAFGQIKYGDGPTGEDTGTSDSTESYGRGRSDSPRAKPKAKPSCCLGVRRKKVSPVSGGEG